MRNKFLTKILGATVGLAMAIGVGVGVAANNKPAREVNAAAGDTAISTSFSTTAEYVIKATNSSTDYYLSGTTGDELNKNVNWGTCSTSGAFYKFKLSGSLAEGNADATVTASTKIGGKTYYLKGLTTGKFNLSTTSSSVKLKKSGEIYESAGSYRLRYNHNGGAGGLRWYNGTTGSPAYFVEAAAFGTLDHIKVKTPASKLAFEVGETFSSSGLVLVGYDGADEETANTQTYSSGFTTSLDGHVFIPSDRGNNKTVTVTYSGKTTTYTIGVSGADIFLNYDNSPFGTATSASSDEATVEVAGIQYKNKYGYNYSTNNTIEFGKNTDAYLGNHTVYTNDIDKIVLTWQKYNNSDEIDVYACTSSLSTENAVEVEASNNGLVSTYTFNGEYPFFKICVNSDAHYMEFKSILVFFGEVHHDVDTVSAVIADKTYYAGATMSASDFSVTVTWTNGKADTHPTEDFTWTVNGTANGVLEEKNNNKVIVIYKGVSSVEYDVVGSPAAAKDVINNTVKTKTSLSYSYHAADNPVSDVLDRELTGIAAAGAYADWHDKTDASSAVYDGYSAGGAKLDNPSLQLKSKNSVAGIVTTASGGKAKTITVVWNSATTEGNVVDVYGKDEAYDSPADLYEASTQGTKIGSMAYGTSTSLTIDDDYSFIGIRANDGAVYFDSIEITWLATPIYTYTNVGIRFAGSISESLWATLNTESTIEGFGFLLATSSLAGSTLQEWYEMAWTEDGVDTIDKALGVVCGNGANDYNVAKNFYKEVDANKPVKVDGNYGWNLFKNVPDGNLTTAYTAVAYIRTTNDGIVFLIQESKSAADVAKDMVTADANFDTDNSLNGSLNYLASLAA